jgi:transcription elongation factor GreA-like protein
MVRAKTIKKDDALSKKKSEVREYSVTDTFDKGEMVYHKVWDDTGEVIEVGTTDDGINKIKVAFEKVGIKTLRMA